MDEEVNSLILLKYGMPVPTEDYINNLPDEVVAQVIMRYLQCTSDFLEYISRRDILLSMFSHGSEIEIIALKTIIINALKEYHKNG